MSLDRPEFDLVMSIDQHKLQHTVAYLILFSLLFLDRALLRGTLLDWHHVIPRVSQGGDALDEAPV
jgi:hypothetical protein